LGVCYIGRKKQPFYLSKKKSTFALQEGMLCFASNVKSLMYPLSFVCGRISILPIWVLTEFTNKDKNIIGTSLCE